MKSLIALFLASLAMLAAPDVATAATADEINASANATLHRFVEQNPSAQELGRKAAGALVFSITRTRNERVDNRAHRPSGSGRG